MDCLLPTELNWVIGNKKKRATKLMEIDTQNKVKQPTILVSCKKKHQARVSSPLPRVVPYLSVIYNLCKLFAVPSRWIAIRVIYHHIWCIIREKCTCPLQVTANCGDQNYITVKNPELILNKKEVILYSPKPSFNKIQKFLVGLIEQQMVTSKTTCYQQDINKRIYQNWHLFVKTDW